MDIYRLERVPWIDSQLLYHALARVGQGGVFILSPDSSYVCVGLNQVVERVVRLAYCREADIPVFRREMGGGATYLDQNSFLYQVVLPKGHPLTAGTYQDVYVRLSRPLVEVCSELGVQTELQPVSAVLVNGRRIAETGVAGIGTSVVFTAALFLKFDEGTFERVLATGDVIADDDLTAVSPPAMTSLKREIGVLPSRDLLYNLLEQRLEALLGTFEACDVDAALRYAAEDVRVRLSSPVWLFRGERRYHLRTLRVRTGIAVRHAVHQAPGGLIHAAVEFDEDLYRIAAVIFSGDFSLYPAEALAWLEQALENVYPEDALTALEGVYETLSLETPGISPEDWFQALDLG